MEDFVGPALQHAEEAVEYDERREYEKACKSYFVGSQHFINAIKYEKMEARKKQLTEKANEIMTRLEQIKKYLDEQAQEGGSDPSGTVMKNRKAGDAE
eukprot:EC850175.1.p1 GENE.EC850175.1~~EC850175.1.p1  ORF type:complete len:98 (+),score=25.76 EC850175.1:100-393(+)